MIRNQNLAAVVLLLAVAPATPAQSEWSVPVPSTGPAGDAAQTWIATGQDYEQTLSMCWELKPSGLWANDRLDLLLTERGKALYDAIRRADGLPGVPNQLFTVPLTVGLTTWSGGLDEQQTTPVDATLGPSAAGAGPGGGAADRPADADVDGIGPQVPSFHPAFLLGVQDCASGLLRPDTGVDIESLLLLEPDGSAAEGTVQLVSLPLQRWLGEGHDTAPFDPAFLDADWPGYLISSPGQGHVPTTIRWSQGSVAAAAPVAALLDVSAPAPLELSADLGATAAHASVAVLISGTQPEPGHYLTRDGVTVPIVPDDLTAWFSAQHRGLAVADSEGSATVVLPDLSGAGLVDRDLFLVCLAVDGSGTALAASTMALLRVRDLSACVR